MKKRMTALLLSACMCAGLAGCGTNTPGNNPGHTKTDSSVTSLTDNITVTSVKTDVTSFDQLKNGINEFSMNMYSALPADENIFYSPYSIASALSMLDVGAGGTTKNELENALGITDLDKWNDEMKAYLSKDWSQNTFVNTANSVWMNKGTTWAANINSDFLTPAKDYYSGEIYEADFDGQADKVVQNVNNWVSDNTNKMIPEILKEIPGGTVMMLINAVYFEGKWDTPFTEDKTFQSSFYGTDKESVVDMMHLYGEHFAYMDNGEIKGITLPYDGDNVVMKVFMPTTDDGDINKLFDKLSNEEKQKLIDSLDDASNVEIDTLQLPKFTDEQSIDGLDDILKNMGIQSAYSESADFSKIADGIAVSSVNHKAKVIVDENGTKAAAETDIMIKETAMMPSEETYNFIVDKPFVYVIEDQSTGMILFMGRVNSL
ncbi:MAG: serpin family protein [Coprococcus sp.]